MPGTLHHEEGAISGTLFDKPLESAPPTLAPQLNMEQLVAMHCTDTSPRQLDPPKLQGKPRQLRLTVTCKPRPAQLEGLKSAVVSLSQLSMTGQSTNIT